MKWIKEKPTKPGWYWWHIKSGFIPDMVYVTKTVGKDRMIILYPHSDKVLYADECGGEWSGPILEPEE